GGGGADAPGFCRDCNPLGNVLPAPGCAPRQAVVHRPSSRGVQDADASSCSEDRGSYSPPGPGNDGLGLPPLGGVTRSPRAWLPFAPFGPPAARRPCPSPPSRTCARAACPPSSRTSR